MFRGQIKTFRLDALQVRKNLVHFVLSSVTFCLDSIFICKTENTKLNNKFLIVAEHSIINSCQVYEARKIFNDFSFAHFLNFVLGRDYFLYINQIEYHNRKTNYEKTPKFPSRFLLNSVIKNSKNMVSGSTRLARKLL